MAVRAATVGGAKTTSAPPAAAGPDRLRDLHARMLDAVLGGDGLAGVAELAAAEAGGSVAIVLPARRLFAVWPEAAADPRLEAYAGARLAGKPGKPGKPPPGLLVEAPVKAGAETVGLVLLLAADGEGGGEGGGAGGGPGAGAKGAALADRVKQVERLEILEMAALASLTEIAVAEAREEVEHTLRGTLLEELRTGDVAGAEVLRRAERFGCDLVRGAVAIVAEARSSRPRHATALISSDYPGAMAELLDQRIYAILPARGGDEAPEATLDAARRLAGRLRTYGPTAVSSFYTDPGELHRAIQEAELVLEVVSRDERMVDQLETGMGSGVYRLLFRVFVSHPEEVRNFYEDTVAAIVQYDDRYRTDLIATLETYLGQDCNMNATARAIYAHRHTVAYRLERIKELSGLDPTLSEDRERLGLGLKAYRIIAPSLPR